MKSLRIVILIVFLSLGSTAPAFSHGGGLDSRGGHNCRTGSCAGTYHCHQPRSEFCKQQLGYTTKSPSKSKSSNKVSTISASRCPFSKITVFVPDGIKKSGTPVWPICSDAVPCTKNEMVTSSATGTSEKRLMRTSLPIAFGFLKISGWKDSGVASDSSISSVSLLKEMDAVRTSFSEQLESAIIEIKIYVMRLIHQLVDHKDEKNKIGADK